MYWGHEDDEVFTAESLDGAGDYSYRARQLGEEWICMACMKKADIDDLWVYDYQQALDELDREFSSAWEEVEDERA